MSVELELTEEDMEFEETEVTPAAGVVIPPVEVKPRVVITSSDEPSVKTVATDEDILKLKRILGLPSEDGDNTKLSHIRLNAVHVRGVQDMSSDDVLAIFKDFDPASLEWVNDLSCNIVFDDNRAAATAIIGLMTHLVITKKTEEEISQITATNGIPTVDAASLEVPVPPDTWVLAKSHPKSKALLIRFATLSDKKKDGAAKYSEFYRKYGNPHYGGKKQIISKSLAAKLAKSKNPLEDGIEEEEVDFDDDNEERRPLGLRMRMRADDEEEKIKRGNPAASGDLVVSIRNDLVDGDEDEEPDEDLARYTRRGKRGSVWDRLDSKRGGDDRNRGSDQRRVSDRSRGIVSRHSREEKKTSVWSRLSVTETQRDDYKMKDNRRVMYSNIRIKK